ncbi:MAG: stage II sporulation protein M [Candidatus Nanoarchaeia archaeon]
MVLESLLNPALAEKKKYKMMFLGFLITLVGALLAFFVFESHASMVTIFLVSLAATPLMYGIIKYEEEKDLQDIGEKVLLQEHSKALGAFMYLFLGITLGIVVLYIFLPWTTVGTLFQAQTDTLSQIRGGITGMSSAEEMNMFSKIFFNNVKVLIFAILFSFVFGAGAIFVLAWNASVIGTAIGNFIRGNIALYSQLIGLDKAAKYFHVITIGLFRYVIHGIPEILAYFVGALAGGIISVAIIKHDFGSQKFEHIVLDAADLLFISIGLLFLAAILEVWITPLIF